MSALPEPVTSSHPVDVGTRTEAAILSRLVDLGYKVLLPFGFNQRYDLVLDLDGHFLRVQCKTARIENGVVLFRARSTRCNRRSVHWRAYTGEIELFLAFCPDNGRLYAVPIEDATQSEVRLRLLPTANGQAKGIRWARDYELPA